MLAAEHRLQKPTDFAVTMRGARKFRAGELLFYYLPTPTPIKFGFIISKKVSKLAVVRNRLRRVLGEQIRAKVDLEKLTGNVVITVLQAPQNDSAAFAASIDQWLAKL
ncbi:MAG TPA: ribonuclease P protein component [Candidatus Saccharimonadales bacterium]|nr:ribonuclease P protein component [Candidatus Saccharimonadales bacterium]